MRELCYVFINIVAPSNLFLDIDIHTLPKDVGKTILLIG